MSTPGTIAKLAGRLPPKSADAAERRVIRRRLGQLIAQKVQDRERVRAARRNCPLAADTFEESNHQHLEVDNRIGADTPGTAIGVIRLADIPDLLVESGVRQHLVKALEEVVRARFDDVKCRKPEGRLGVFLIRAKHAAERQKRGQRMSKDTTCTAVHRRNQSTVC
jgi:hypothetical protein